MRKLIEKNQLFQQGHLLPGLTLPLLRGQIEYVDYHEQLRLPKQADEAGFRTLRVPDVPLNNPGYPNHVAHLDPWVFLGARAAQTEQILLVCGAIVALLRHPYHISKGALSVSALSGR